MDDEFDQPSLTVRRVFRAPIWWHLLSSLHLTYAVALAVVLEFLLPALAGRNGNGPVALILTTVYLLGVFWMHLSAPHSILVSIEGSIEIRSLWRSLRIEAEDVQSIYVRGGRIRIQVGHRTVNVPFPLPDAEFAAILAEYNPSVAF